MIRRNVLDLVTGQDSRELGLPVLERRLPPEIIGPEKTALQEIVAQAKHLRLAELRGARVLDGDEGTPEQLFVVGVHDETIWLTAGLKADARLRQLREADAEVGVGVGIVGPPALAAGLAPDGCVEEAAEAERAVEARVGCKPRRHAADAAPLKVVL